MNVILVGPPGVGKGTQATVLEHKTALKHIASGDLFRYHMQEETPLGLVAKQYVDSGGLVPNDVVIGMILERIQEPDCEAGVIFDGFPRTAEQARALAEALVAHDQQIDAVIFLNAPRDVLLKRIIGRQTCRRCHTTYNIFYTPPRDEATCDLCGGDLYTRTDDNMATARHRLMIYLEQTKPLIQHYQELGLLHEIDGLGEVEAVTSHLVQALGLPEPALS